jgi:hypothetical protein
MAIALRFAANAEPAGFQSAKLLEAESYTERATTGWARKGDGGTFSMLHDMNRVTVAVDGMKITGVFESHWAKSPRASDLVVGTQVEAKVTDDKLVIALPNAREIKARIVRREIGS